MQTGFNSNGFQQEVNLGYMCPKTQEDIEEMKKIPYQSAVGSLMYLILGTRPDIAYAVGVVSQFNSNYGKEHWQAVKRIF